VTRIEAVSLIGVEFTSVRPGPSPGQKSPIRQADEAVRTRLQPLRKSEQTRSLLDGIFLARARLVGMAERKMSDGKQDSSMKLLVVDDAPAIRTSLVCTLTEMGYAVRSAEDGFAALIEIRKDIPDILLSDLNMPGMSGFELLSVVRKRFPSIFAIAMSGSFSGEEVPSGVIADAFYHKGSSVRSLLKIIGLLGQQKPRLAKLPPVSAPLWIKRNGSDSSGRPYVPITCPECLRTSREIIGGSLALIREAHCVHCGNSIYYGIIEPVDWTPAAFSLRNSEANLPPLVVDRP